MMIHEEIVHVCGIPKKLIIFLHGYLDDCSSLDAKLLPFRENLHDRALHIPQAPHKCEVGKGMRQWYSMYRFDPNYERRDVKTFDDFLCYYDRMGLGLEETYQYLLPYIEQTLSEYNLDYNDLILCGFSQGAMVALYTALINPHKISGLVSFSGILAGHQRVLKYAKNNPDTLLIHGKSDKSLRPEALRFTEKQLQSLGCSVQTHIFNHCDHELNEEGLRIASEFVNQHSGTK
ncbi:MAG: hypothetical protein IJW72_01155 [Alphaproteobacteria bacterium]|nr:hypothetical protein [Alphaproteobacteria bacterium]